MKCNVGKKDRMFRIVTGIIFALAGASLQNILVMIVGIILVLTGLLRWCPLYVPFKFSTEK